MLSRSAFDLDCNPVIPECGYECPKCVEEIESTITGKDGVSNVYLETEGQEQRIVIEHDPETMTVEQLLDIFKELPTLYKGFFIPTLIDSSEEKN